MALCWCQPASVVQLAIPIMSLLASSVFDIPSPSATTSPTHVLDGLTCTPSRLPPRHSPLPPTHPPTQNNRRPQPGQRAARDLAHRATPGVHFKHRNAHVRDRHNCSCCHSRRCRASRQTDEFVNYTPLLPSGASSLWEVQRRHHRDWLQQASKLRPGGAARCWISPNNRLGAPAR